MHVKPVHYYPLLLLISASRRFMAAGRISCIVSVTLCSRDVGRLVAIQNRSNKLRDKLIARNVITGAPVFMEIHIFTDII